MDARQRFAAEVRRMRADTGLSLAKLGAAAHIERSYVHNIITGRRWPSQAVAQGLDSALGAQGTLLTLWSEGQAEPPTRPPDVVRGRHGRCSLDESRPWRSDVEHDPALRSLALEQAALDRSVLDWVIGNSPPLIRADRSGQWVIDQDVHIAADMLALFRKLDHVHGAGHVRKRAVSYLATEVDDLLSRPPADRSTGIALMGVAAGICEMIGYQAVDVGANGLAAYYYIAALRFAEASGERAYGAHLIAANIAHLALHAGHPNDALRMILAAQQEIHTATSPAVRSARHAVEARVYARLRNEKACTAALIKAESSLSRADLADGRMSPPGSATSHPPTSPTRPRTACTTSATTTRPNTSRGPPSPTSTPPASADWPSTRRCSQHRWPSPGRSRRHARSDEKRSTTPAAPARYGPGYA